MWPNPQETAAAFTAVAAALFSQIYTRFKLMLDHQHKSFEFQTVPYHLTNLHIFQMFNFNIE